MVMLKLRRRKPASYLLPDGLALRTIRSPFHVIPDEKEKRFRISSAAFAPTDDGAVSVDLEQLLREDNLPPTALYPMLNQAVALLAHALGFLMEQTLSTAHEPVRQNWYHGGITGNFSKGVKRTLSANCGYVIEIDQDAARQHWEAVRGPVPF